LSFLCGYVQRCVHIFRRGINVGAMLQEQHYDIDVAQTRRDVQRRLLLLKIEAEKIKELQPLPEASRGIVHIVNKDQPS